ncbi:MAG: single-stranded DNA-binding protein, partial [Verrucomicrobiales bacterium]
MSLSRELLTATEQLRESLRGLHFGPPVSHVYNPLEYARTPHEAYVDRFGNSRKRVLLMGMNPGPWGMAPV